ncbi:GGDEF domain-containing protein [Marinobacter sp.]|uniref:GGDEF domain-containing protein n=1 Tax=Marinobacter sp. TaxID=50741 RepID=UPI0034A0F591
MTPETTKQFGADLSQFRVRGEIPVPTLIGWLTLAAVPLLALFAYRSFLQGDSTTPTLLVVFAGLLAANGLVYLVTTHTTLQRRGFIAITTALFVYLAVSAAEDGSAIIWLFAYPPIIFYISQSKIGVIACGGGLAAVALLFSPIGDLIFDSPYTTSFRLTMLAVLAFEMSTCYVLDQSRRRSKLSLLRLANEFEYAAKHDALTGLANRRELMAQLEHEYQRYLRNARSFSVLLMDIDLFKSVNDNYGHHVGDDIIVMVASTLREQCRKVDTLSRWGGEEYLVLLPETGTKEAVQTANRVREAVASQSADAEGQKITATVSIGVATITGSESVDRLLQRADEALYQAKTLGRNTVCSSEEPGKGSE